MAVTFEEIGNEWRFTNDDGAWSIWDQPTVGEDGQSVIGPGYIGRVVLNNGKILVDDFKPWGDLNDPRIGGLGAIGWHHARRNNEVDIHSRTWDLSVRQNANDNRFGVSAVRNIDGPRITEEGDGRFKIEVDITDKYSHPNPVMTIIYDYKFEASNVKQWITIRSRWDGSGPALFIKQPKISLSLNQNDAQGTRYRKASIYNKQGVLLTTKSLMDLVDPSIETWKIGVDGRARVQFYDELNGLKPFNVMIQAAPETFSATRVLWANAPYGMDRWAQLANEREMYEVTGTAGCESEGVSLSRQWEISKRPEEWNIGLTLAAWKNGRTHSDCTRSYRAWGPVDESYTTYMSYSYDSGWLI